MIANDARWCWTTILPCWSPVGNKSKRLNTNPEKAPMRRHNLCRSAVFAHQGPSRSHGCHDERSRHHREGKDNGKKQWRRICTQCQFIPPMSSSPTSYKSSY